MSNNLTSVADCDYLEEDPPIRGQNYACVSFLSPEKILDDKNTFIFTKFTENFCKDMNEMFHNMKEKYPEDADGFQAIADRYRFLFNKRHMQEEYKYFLDEKEEEYTKEFNESVDFQTNVRGFKLRGVYDSMKEAQIRSEVLKRKDKNHNIYITQVGCWCPWDPNPDEIQDQHYGEDALNTLMKKYRENQSHKDEVFDERKDKMIEAQKERHKLVDEQNKLEEEKKLLENPEDSENIVLNAEESNVEKVVEDVKETMENAEELVKDVKETVDKTKEVVEDVEETVEDVKKVITNSGIGEDNTVVENYNETSNTDINNKVFENSDPWMKSKE